MIVRTFLALTTVSAAAAQGVIHIDASAGPSCAECRIELTKLASLGSLTDAELPQPFGRLAMDTRGRVFVPNIDLDKVLVYDTTARYLRAIGRRGGGPGEFGQIQRVTVFADSLYVVNGERVSVFSPSLAYVRSTSTLHKLPSNIVPASDGSMILNTAMQLRVAEFPLYALAADGRMSNGFGSDSSAVNPVCATCRARTPFPARRSGTVWVLRPNAYIVDRWGANGALLERIHIDGSKWFEPFTTSEPTYQSPKYVRPATIPMGLVEDAAGRLWIASRGPVTGWKAEARAPVPTAPAGGRGGGGPVRGVLDPAVEKKRATIIEIIDPKTRRLLVSQRFDGRDLTLLSSELVASAHEDQDGTAIVDLWRVRVVGLPRTGAASGW